MIPQNEIEQYCREHVLTSVEWADVSEYYKLSESFIREFAKELDWYKLCIHQKLSEELMMEFPKKLWLREVVRNQEVSLKFIKWLIKETNPDEWCINSLTNVLKRKNILL